MSMVKYTAHDDAWWPSDGNVVISPPGMHPEENLVLTPADLIKMLQELGHTYKPPVTPEDMAGGKDGREI